MATLSEALDRAARWLPHQGPLARFVHTNTLAELEHLDFHDALSLAGRTLGATMRPAEEDLRRMLADGRTRESDLRAVFDAQADLSEQPVGPDLPSPRALAWTLLRNGIDETHWRLRAFHVAEGRPDPLVQALDDRVRAMLANGARREFSRDLEGTIARLVGTADPVVSRRRLRAQLGLEGPGEALRVCMADDVRAAGMGFALLTAAARRGLPERPRVRRDHVDREAVAREVDAVLIPVVAAFLDLGQADLRPDPAQGLLAVGIAALRRRADLRRAVEGLIRPDGAATLQAALDSLGVGPDRLDELLRQVLLARPGWAGSVRWREHHGGPALVDYAALRLVLTIACARQAEVDPLVVLAPAVEPNRGLSSRAALVAQALAVAFVSPLRAEALAPSTWQALEALVERLDGDWRCRLLQEAREASALRLWLSGLSQRAARGPDRGDTPRAQWLCCIDDREESFRRALEEAGGEEVDTYGLAGHFNLAIQWRGVDEIQPSARHPVVLPSTHRVEEQARGEAPRLRRTIGRATAWLDRVGLRTAAGAVAALGVGLPAILLAAWRVLAPRSSDVVLDRWRARWLPSPPTALAALRADETPTDGGAGHGEEHSHAHGHGQVDLPLGLTAEEAALRLAGALRLIGLTEGFAPMVVVVGHGAVTSNNPHEAAYNCGACGGSPGGGNARAFAVLANAPAVRAALSGHGVRIPDGTVFVGAQHDTTSDHLDLAPETVLPEGDRAWLVDIARRAAAQDALERGRRFMDLSSEATPEQALRHAEGRAADLSQVRPEYGHATNALLVVGPRALTRGLFLDRRAFLHSYEPEADPQGLGLQALLGAAVPVCAGINLEYYFSRVDNRRLGAGSKLPLNIIGLHGVMSGSLGDLRTGLPRQMVEIHEPTRLPVVVFAPRDRVQAVVVRLEAVQRLVENHWIRLAVIDAEGTWTWRDGAFAPADLSPFPMPVGEDSLRVCRGRHDSLVPIILGGRAR